MLQRILNFSWTPEDNHLVNPFCHFSPFFHSRRLCGHQLLFPHAPYVPLPCSVVLTQFCSGCALPSMSSSGHFLCVCLLSQACFTGMATAISLATQRLPFLPLQMFAVVVPDRVFWVNSTDAVLCTV